MKNFDNSFLSADINLIAGIDEAGRGSIAGPVVAASVIFDKDTFIEGVDDSKKLTPSKRITCFEQINKKALSIGIGILSNREIDNTDILKATLRAMKISLNALEVKPDLVLVDGNQIFGYEGKIMNVVKGDSKSFVIAAASIIAKVHRDIIMEKLAVEYPMYLWDRNKGYGTREHFASLKRNGISEFHRKTFLKRIFNPQVDLF
jgi:ribonuclease HII